MEIRHALSKIANCFKPRDISPKQCSGWIRSHAAPPGFWLCTSFSRFLFAFIGFDLIILPFTLLGEDQIISIFMVSLLILYNVHLRMAVSRMQFRFQVTHQGNRLYFFLLAQAPFPFLFITYCNILMTLDALFSQF